MKVGELILALLQFNPDAEVELTNGMCDYEVLSVYSKNAKPVPERPGYLGSETDRMVTVDIG